LSISQNRDVEERVKEVRIARATVLQISLVCYNVPWRPKRKSSRETEALVEKAWASIIKIQGDLSNKDG